jgi:hypothetical protein
MGQQLRGGTAVNQVTALRQFLLLLIMIMIMILILGHQDRDQD